jgi:hypothetical protein
MHKIKCNRWGGQPRKSAISFPCPAFAGWSLPNSGRAIQNNAIRASKFWLLTPEFWLLSRENIFWKNEPKLCPSLLTIVKKRTQNEPK